MKSRSIRWTLLVAANVLFLCVLCFYQRLDAQPRPAAGPFNNSVQQRENMIRELREVKDLLKEQNALLRSGIRVKQDE